MNKVVLVLVDGLRPDAVLNCEHSFMRELAKMGASDLRSRTVMPSVTLPCHASLFLSVDPERHGILTNTWHAQVRPIESLSELVHRFGKTNAMYFNWEQLRDLGKPGTMDYSYFRSQGKDDEKNRANDTDLTDRCIEYMKAERPDFSFLYLGATDSAGHKNGWMSEEYLKTVSNASDCIKRVFENLEEGDSLIVTADHGGHDRSHGDDTPECMTIPIIFYGAAFEKGKKLEGVSIKDIAPTIAKLLSLPAPEDWEGKSVV